MKRTPLAAALALAFLAFAAPAGPAVAAPWPPADGPGALYVHFGEEHWNDADGLTLLPKVVADSVRYRPALVTMSGDKGNDGNTEELERWRQIMEPYDRAGVPYFAGVGNHDRDAPPGAGGLPPPGSIEPYKQVFSGRPYPMGDAGARPADDPPGASTHYYADHGNVRWVFIDNSCFAIEECDSFQNPSAQNAAGRPQLDWLRDVAGEAGRAGKLVFAVMHMPTQDPGDQSYRDTIAFNHVMGKGAGTDDNAKFEQVAEEAGIDGVFVAHIKGQFLYRGRGGVPYYIDGGAGGELYTTGPVGTDHGYWHGYRLIRVDGTRFTTDAVPIFAAGGITIRGPSRLPLDSTTRFEAFGAQPVFNDPAKVPELELRDPDPVPRGSGGAGGVAGGAWLLIPLLAFGFAALASNGRLPRPRPAVAAPAAAGLLLASLAAASMAQRSAPTSTPKDSLPNPARIWTSSNHLVLAPLASDSEDPRRDPRTQTHDGGFRARCPGKTRLTIDSGFESAALGVTVPTRRGRLVRKVRVLKPRVRAGRKRRIARVRLGQRGEILVRAFKGRRPVRTLRNGCFAPGRTHSFFWDGKVPNRAGRLVSRPGRYRVEVRVRSDRKPFVRRRTIRVLKRRRSR